MLNAWPQAAVHVNLLSSVSAANTAAATSAWVQASNKEGTICVLVNVGAVTGTLVLTLEDATDSGGTGGAGFTANEGAFAAATANTQHKRTFAARACRGWFRVVGTVTTGPSLIAASFLAHPKNT
jgi:hypothetical protein